MEDNINTLFKIIDPIVINIEQLKTDFNLLTVNEFKNAIQNTETESSDYLTDSFFTFFDRKDYQNFLDNIFKNNAKSLIEIKTKEFKLFEQLFGAINPFINNLDENGKKEFLKRFLKMETKLNINAIKEIEDKLR